MPRTQIIIPTYNERENVANMLDALLALRLPDVSILVVDDNSPDGTGQIVEDYKARFPGKVDVLHRAGKSGLGRAYVDGFRYSIVNTDADYFIQMDVDFSHQPKYVPQLIAAMQTGDYAFVSGSRYVVGGGVEEEWSIYRKLLSWFANRVYVRTLLNIPLNDATGGFRIWSRESLIALDLERIQSNGYVFQVEIAYVIHKLGFKVHEIPIHFPDRKAGTSKMGLDIQVEAAGSVFRVLRKYHNITPADRRTQTYTFTPIQRAEPLPEPAS